MADTFPCPRCQGNGKAVGKKWEYGVFQAEAYYCKKCDKQFNVYFREGKYNHTVPKKKE